MSRVIGKWNFHCTIDGKEYIRFSAESWGEWMGESLELVQFGTAQLEAAFQDWNREHAFTIPFEPRDPCRGDLPNSMNTP